jgi:hypothetical protein
MADSQARPGDDSDDESDDDTADPTPGSLERPDVDGAHPTGAEQAAINRRDDPPA